MCSRPGMEDFGVEVTDFFLTESDARLERIGSYACDLIAGRDYRSQGRSEGNQSPRCHLSVCVDRTGNPAEGNWETHSTAS